MTTFKYLIGVLVIGLTWALTKTVPEVHFFGAIVLLTALYCVFPIGIVKVDAKKEKTEGN